MSAGDVSRLVTLAGRFLRTMQLEDGLFCEERVRGDAHPQGRSLRYSLMTYIGLAKAGAAVDGFDLDALRAALWTEVASAGMRPGDYGLYLWADGVRGDGSDVAELIGRADEALDIAGGLPGREGQEVSWLATGLLRNPVARETDAGARLLRASLDELL